MRFHIDFGHIVAKACCGLMFAYNSATPDQNNENQTTNVTSCYCLSLWDLIIESWSTAFLCNCIHIIVSKQQIQFRIRVSRRTLKNFNEKLYFKKANEMVNFPTSLQNLKLDYCLHVVINQKKICYSQGIFLLKHV